MDRPMEMQMVGWARKKRRTVREKQVDRISSLPDDLLHLILSKTDATQVIRTSEISPRWRYLWKSLPHLNFNRSHFSRLTDFSKFVTRFLSHRDPHSGISVINLQNGRGLLDPSLVKKISSYAVSHNAGQLVISSAVSRRGVRKFPLSAFSCQSLQQLHLSTMYIRLGNSPAWNLPNLTTLILQDIPFEFICDGDDKTKSVDLFSNLTNLKNLSLVDCLTGSLKVFKITSPSLENFTFSSMYWVDKTCQYVVSAPNLIMFNYYDNSPLLRLSSMEKVHIRVEFDKKSNQLTYMMGILHIPFKWLKKEFTQRCNDSTVPSKVVANVCNISIFMLFKQWRSLQARTDIARGGN